MNKLSNKPSKIPIAITRVRKCGGAAAKLESSKRDEKQLERKGPSTLRPSRTIKKIPNFKKLHKQFEAHMARGKVKKKPPTTVFVEFPVKANKEETATSLTQRNHYHYNKDTSNKHDEVTITSIPSVAVVQKVTKESHRDEDIVLKFKELCKQYQNGCHRRPLRHINKQTNRKQVIELPSDEDFKMVAEKAAYSQHRRCTMRHRPITSPAYTRGMREASETMLRSVKRFCKPSKSSYHQLDDVRANLAEQLDCCGDKVAIGDYNSIQQHSRRNMVIL